MLTPSILPDKYPNPPPLDLVRSFLPDGKRSALKQSLWLSFSVSLKIKTALIDIIKFDMVCYLMHDNRYKNANELPLGINKVAL